MYAPDQVARIVHEANRALQQVNDDPAIAVSPPWHETDEETQNSAISGVLGVLKGNSPEESHEGWCAYKTEHGSEREKAKDALFVAIVNALGRDTEG